VRTAGDRLGIYNALFSLAQLAMSLGEYDEAILRFTLGIQPSQEMGDLLNVAYILEELGVVKYAATASRIGPSQEIRREQNLRSLHFRAA
jgi:hypothetical protein